MQAKKRRKGSIAMVGFGLVKLNQNNLQGVLQKYFDDNI